MTAMEQPATLLRRVQEMETSMIEPAVMLMREKTFVAEPSYESHWVHNEPEGGRETTGVVVNTPDGMLAAHEMSLALSLETGENHATSGTDFADVETEGQMVIDLS